MLHPQAMVHLMCFVHFSGNSQVNESIFQVCSQQAAEKILLLVICHVSQMVYFYESRQFFAMFIAEICQRLEISDTWDYAPFLHRHLLQLRFQST